MALTVELQHPRSPVRQFLDDALPGNRAVTASFRAAARNTLIRSTPAPVTVPGPDGTPVRYPASPVGHAFSVRATLLFTANVHDITALVTPFHPVSGKDWKALSRLRDLLPALTGMAGFTARTDDEERWAARVCYALGLVDQLYRAGPHPGMPLLDLPADTPVQDLLALAPDAVIDDLLALTGIARSVLAPLKVVGATVTEAPTFTGSMDVGGADGDLVVGSTLLELKTSRKLDLTKQHVQQLATYALLDYDDDYKLTNVAVYLARHGLLVSWPLAELLAMLAGAPTDPSELRQRLRCHLLGYRRTQLANV